MKNRKHILAAVAASTGMLILILDAKTALNGALEGITLCLNTVIPSLFPFFLLSVLLNSTLLGMRSTFLQPIGKVLGIPFGAESLLLIGLIGGYPVGAQCISEAYRNKRLCKTDAHRMLGFCSNAGPAFIFGMGSCIFDRAEILWSLWAIHILSALVVGLILPGKSRGNCTGTASKTITLTQALEKSIRILASVCGWIVLFRVILSFLNRWCLWLLPNAVQALLTGLLELANGCYALSSVQSYGARFVLCSAFLSFGGICVLMQTSSVTEGLGLGMYFPGKIIQCCLSVIISCLLQSVLFSETDRFSGCLIYATIATIIGVFTTISIRSKKRVAILC